MFHLLAEERLEAIWPLLRLGPSQCLPFRQVFDLPRAYPHILYPRSAQCGLDPYQGGASLPNPSPWASIHFHMRSLELHRSERVSPLTLTTSAASPWPYPPRRLPPWYELPVAALWPLAIDCR